MEFTHVVPPCHIPDLPEKIINGQRHYLTPCGPLPSMTTTLSILGQPGLEKWKQNVGEDVANIIARNAAIRGTQNHKIIEDYLSNRDISQYQKKVLAWGLFNLEKDTLDRIDKIQALEKTLYTCQLGVAGRTDAIAEFDGMPSIIDFKTSTRAKKEEWIQNYYLQETGYSLMWEERTSNEIQQIVTIIASEDGEIQVFIKKRDEFIPKVKACIEAYYQRQSLRVKQK